MAGNLQVLAQGCNLESLKFVDTSAAIGVLDFEGWFADVDHGRVSDEVDIILRSPAGDYVAKAPTIDGRSDVAEHFYSPLLSRSGFALTAEMSDVPLGSYDVQLVQRYGHDTVVCKTNRIVTISTSGVATGVR
jgi:hypothetical protein